MKRQVLLLLVGALSSAAGVAADRSITVPPKVATSWGALTHSTAVKQSRTLGVGFWQRGSGAKPGVGENFASAIEFQLPEAASNRLRSATFQFSGKPSQCVGAEPVVVDVYAYTGDGKGDLADVTAGTRIAQMSADCTDQAAFARPIDVTHVVRQTTVASGIRFAGFNVRKGNNRQGPGLFVLSPGKLTVVIADQDIDKSARPGLAPAPRSTGAAALPAPVAATAAAKPSNLSNLMARGDARSAAAVPTRKGPASTPTTAARNQLRQ
jgi:hypothetical protein